MPAFTIKFGNNTGTNPYSFTPIVQGGLVGISCLGGLISGIIAIKLIPLLGMRSTVFVAMCCYSIGNSLILMVNSWEWVLVARVFNGLCIGLVTITCPMYLSEITPIQVRGLFTSFNQLFTTIGILIGSLTILFSDTNYFPHDPSQYQYPLGQGIVFASIAAILIWYVPESPNWLVKTSKPIEKIKKSVSRIRGMSLNDEHITNITVSLIDSNFRQHNRHSNSKSKYDNSIIYGKPKYFQRVVTGILLLGLQQLTGVNYFMFYGITIFEHVNLRNPYLVPVIFGVINLIFSILSIYIVGIFKRKTMLIFGSITLSILMGLFTIIGSLLSKTFTSAVLLIISASSFMSIFGLSWGPLSSVIVSEMYPPNIKVKAMSICGACAWVFNFSVSLVIPLLTEKMGFSVGGIFSGITLLGGLFVYFLVPETKNISTSKIDKIYESRKSTFGLVLQN